MRHTVLQPTRVVPVLSLGATRRFLIKPVSGGKSLSLTVAADDQVVMGGRSQHDWRHSVPRQATPASPPDQLELRAAPGFLPRPPQEQD
jgi:alkylated DNA repair dioxygenase AlkB